MVVETIHVMDANETRSEAFKNYAGAAFLIGMAVMSVGIGMGVIAQSVKTIRRKSSSNVTDDLISELRKRTSRRKPADLADVAAEAAVDGLRKATLDILNKVPGSVFDQNTSKFPKYYFVKKSYKEPVSVGTMVPEKYLVVKLDTTTMDDFMKQETLKFKSKTSLDVSGGGRFVIVEEILNSEPVKPV